MKKKKEKLLNSRIAYFELLISKIITSGLSGGEIVHMLSRLRCIRSELKRYENIAEEKNENKSTSNR